VNRTEERAVVLASRINLHFARNIAAGSGEHETSRLAATADIVVNVSTKGATGPLADYSALAAAELPVTPGAVRRNLAQSSEILDRIPRTAILSDVVIAEGGTPFLRQARERGFAVLDGLAMVINQGVEAFWILHGQELQHAGLSKENVAVVMRAAAMRGGPA
jgi:shikimate 5-dehydrogenase